VLKFEIRYYRVIISWTRTLFHNTLIIPINQRISAFIWCLLLLGYKKPMKTKCPIPSLMYASIGGCSFTLAHSKCLVHMNPNSFNLLFRISRNFTESAIGNMTNQNKPEKTASWVVSLFHSEMCPSHGRKLPPYFLSVSLYVGFPSLSWERMSWNLQAKLLLIFGSNCCLNCSTLSM
jgi:hypothetical protein